MTAKKRKIPRPVFFETTIPVIKPCRRCGVWLAAGVAEGIHAEVEFVVLDPTQSVLAKIAGLELYALTRTGLVQLDDYRLRDERFSSKYPEHQCGVVWTSNLPGAGDQRPNAAQSHIPPY
jgi:hypothetical protein